ncbi:hypothetical protein OH492_13380 [Vibrio chagasii]|nr:hypothetical protein [Vibrio chagasii]
MNEESGIYLNQQSIRTAYAFGAFVPHNNDYDKGVNQGGGYPADIVMQSQNKSFFAPNILVGDLMIMKVSGLTLEFFHTPGRRQMVLHSTYIEQETWSVAIPFQKVKPFQISTPFVVQSTVTRP